MTPHLQIAAGALVCALSIVAGAFGAHGLKARLTPEALELWETAARYFFYTGVGLALIGLTSSHAGAGRLFGAAGWCLALGGLVFSGTVAALALGGPRWLGAVTPLGGLGMIAGFVLLAVAAFGAGAPS